MSGLRKLSTAATAAAAVLIVGLAADTAEARRGFRYRAAPARIYRAPSAARYGRAYRAPVRYGVGYRGETVGGPRFGVAVGF